jgi:methyl-accepting chemotaxis protein
MPEDRDAMRVETHSSATSLSGSPRAWRHQWPLLAAVGVALLLVGGLGLNWRVERAAAFRQAHDSLLSQEYAPRRREVEQFFTLAYQTARTIGLLPSVRSIQGGNRRDDSEDVVVSGRFSAEGDKTVQQLYNNLAANESVSEVYCILDGFDRRRGDVPFFMYDQLILGSRAAGEGHETTTSDTPEEFEEDEYAYYPRQIEQLKAAYPRFNASSLDDIPAIGSPLMRTCDNSQYSSKARGNVADAAGFMYSVPFYTPGGDFRGIISVIFRANVLEAKLLGVPHLNVTEDDRADAMRRGFQVPRQPGDFVLANPERGLWVGDRRDAKLVDDAKAMLAANRADDGRLHVEKLATADASPWYLVYRYNPAVMARTASREASRFWIELFGVLAVAIAVILGPVGIHMKKSQILSVESRIREIAEGGGDLTRRLDIRRKDEVGQLGRSFDGLLDLVHDLIVSIKQSAERVSSGSHEISSGSARLSTALQKQAVQTEELSTTLSGLSSAVHDGATEARAMSQQALTTAGVAIAGGRAVDGSRAAMSAVLASSKKIAAIVDLVEEIALQSNMLALNAAVEAAHAGQHGRGFAVVANEMRQLASRTADAAREIQGLIRESSQRTAEMHESIERSGARLEEIAAAVGDLASRISGFAETSEEHASGITLLNAAVRDIDDVVRVNSAIAEESSSVAQSLAEQADGLRHHVDRVHVHESQIAEREPVRRREADDPLPRRDADPGSRAAA